MKETVKDRNRSGYICSIDNLGRIVIPSAMRKNYDMEKGQQIEMIAVQNGILLRKYEPGCMFCGNINDLTLFQGRIICKECIERMARGLE